MGILICSKSYRVTTVHGTNTLAPKLPVQVGLACSGRFGSRNALDKLLKVSTPLGGLSSRSGRGHGPWDESTCSTAAEGGVVDLFRLTLGEGLSWECTAHMDASAKRAITWVQHTACGAGCFE